MPCLFGVLTYRCLTVLGKIFIFNEILAFERILTEYMYGLVDLLVNFAKPVDGESLHWSEI